MPTLSPVDHDPFGGPMLVPVDHDPFQDNLLAQYNTTARALGAAIVQPAVEAYQHAANLAQGRGDWGMELAGGLLAAAGLVVPEARGAAGVAERVAPEIGGAISKVAADPFANAIRAWHGTANPLNELRVPATGNERAIFLTSNQDEAHKFALMKGGDTIHPVDIQPDAVATYRYRDFADDPIYDPEVMQNIFRKAKTDGVQVAKVTGIQNFEHGGKSTTYAVFDPAAIRVHPPYIMNAVDHDPFAGGS